MGNEEREVELRTCHRLLLHHRHTRSSCPLLVQPHGAMWGRERRVGSPELGRTYESLIQRNYGNLSNTSSKVQTTRVSNGGQSGLPPP